MLILAIDASSLPASAALVSNDKTIAEVLVNNKLNHSVTLMPMVDYLFKLADTDLSAVDYIAVTTGPGSFTGLRIGAATAKGLAHGAGKQIIGIPTLDALCYNLYNTEGLIAPVMDARCGQVYASFYEGQKRLTDYMAEDINKIIDIAASFNKNVTFLGDGVFVHKDAILSASPRFRLAPLNNNAQRAASVGLAAMLDISNAVQYDSLQLFYLRIPQAEREYNVHHTKNEGKAPKTSL